MAKPKEIPAAEALNRLIEGNKRFAKNRRTGVLAVHRDIEKLMLKSRGPFAIVLSCSDSRAPAEILFDQGLGDLFMIRVAGNVVAPSLIGSIEFAAATTQARLVVVMGHTHCGAIQATYDSILGNKTVDSDNIHDIVERIRPNISDIVTRKKPGKTSEKILIEAMRANVLASAHYLRSGSRFLADMVRRKKLLVVGAQYDIETGLVDFFDLSQIKTTAKKMGRRTGRRQINR